MKVFFIPLLIIALLPISGFSQEILTLEDAVKIALQNNYAIQISGTRLEIAGNNATIGNAGFLPTIDARASQQNTIENFEQERITGEKIEMQGARSNALNAGAFLNWTVFDGLGMFVNYNQLKELRQLSDLELKQTIENTIADVMQVYHEIILQKELLLVLDTALELSDARLQLTQDRLEIGSGSQLDVSIAIVDFNADRSALLFQKEILEDAKIRLNTLLAREVTTEFDVSDTIELLPVLDYGEIAQKAGTQNPSVLIANRQRSIAGLQVKQVRAAAFPQIGVNAGYEYDRFSSQSGFLSSNKNLGFNYGVTASFTLFDGLNYRRSIQNAKLNTLVTNLQMEQTINNVDGLVASAYNTYSKSLERLEMEEENLEAARFSLDISFERHQLGDLPAIEFREAQTNFILAESRYFDALYRAKAAEIELLRLSGQILTTAN